jgi:hypothetical protein
VAGIAFVRWVRQELDRAGRPRQWLLVLADGAYDNLGFWRNLPPRTLALVRTARNRRLRELPPPYPGQGRRRKYGEVAPKPSEWLKVSKGWSHCLGARPLIKHRYQLHSPYLRERAAAHPCFLLVVGGASWKAGKREPKRVKRQPAFYLVSAVEVKGTWQLPLPVAHREMKSGFGVGEKQGWNQRSTVLAVQWGVWVYALLLLAGYRTWSWLGGHRHPLVGGMALDVGRSTPSGVVAGLRCGESRTFVPLSPPPPSCSFLSCFSRMSQTTGATPKTFRRCPTPSSRPPHQPTQLPPNPLPQHSIPQFLPQRQPLAGDFRSASRYTRQQHEFNT